MKKLISILIIIFLALILVLINLNKSYIYKNDDGICLKKANHLSGEVVIKDEYKKKELVKIGPKAFYQMKEITSVTLGNNIYEIGKLAFASCEKLERFTFNDNCVIVNNNLFTNNIKLKEVFINCSSKLRYISGAMFYNCISLSKITLPDNLYSVGSYSFYNCTSLEEVSLSSATYLVEATSFINCYNLKRLYLRGDSLNYLNWIEVIPNNVEIIFI